MLSTKMGYEPCMGLRSISPSIGKAIAVHSEASSDHGYYLHIVRTFAPGMVETIHSDGL
jgi:hypothetical protein